MVKNKDVDWLDFTHIVIIESNIAITYIYGVIVKDKPVAHIWFFTSVELKPDELIIHLKDELNITSVVVTHDMGSVRKVANRVAMLHGGEIIFDGVVDELDTTDNEIVRQFVEGRAEGPIKPAFIRQNVKQDYEIRSGRKSLLKIKYQ